MNQRRFGAAPGYHDHDYLREQIPPSKKDLKKLELFNAVLAGGQTEAAVAPAEEPAAEPAEEPAIEPAEETVTEAAQPAAAAKKRGRTKKA